MKFISHILILVVWVSLDHSYQVKGNQVEASTVRRHKRISKKKNEVEEKNLNRVNLPRFNEFGMNVGGGVENILTNQATNFMEVGSRSNSSYL